MKPQDFKKGYIVQTGEGRMTEVLGVGKLAENETYYIFLASGEATYQEMDPVSTPDGIPLYLGASVYLKIKNFGWINEVHVEEVHPDKVNLRSTITRSVFQDIPLSSIRGKPTLLIDDQEISEGSMVFHKRRATSGKVVGISIANRTSVEVFLSWEKHTIATSNIADLSAKPHPVLLVGEYQYPRPESEPLPMWKEYYIPIIGSSVRQYAKAVWCGSIFDQGYLKDGLVHLSEEKATTHAQAFNLYLQDLDK